MGSRKQQVLHAMGNPEYSTSTRFRYGGYGSNEVTFSYDGNVTGWDNVGGILELVPYTPNGSTVAVGDTKLEVLQAMGNPEYSTSTRFRYGSSEVTFSYDGYVTGF